MHNFIVTEIEMTLVKNYLCTVYSTRYCVQYSSVSVFRRSTVSKGLFG